MKVLDLFSGIGGFSLGLERAGMKTVAFCEIDETCRKVLRKHWPYTYIYPDVSTLSKDKYLRCKRSGKALDVDIDVICGGFPCQDISVAGLKKGLKGERSGLWGQFKRLIKEIKPRYAIIENVANLRSNGLQEVLKDLWQIGYASEWHIISARSVGACHLRERIWIIAYPCSEGSKGRDIQRGHRERLSQQEGSKPTGEGMSRVISERSINPTYGNNFRLWKPFASEEEKSQWWSEATSSFRPVFGKIYEVEPTIHRDDDGFSAGLDRPRKERIKQLGNAVVPQIPELIGRAIMEYEYGTTKVH
jgi:DNA (cytosine-5)-methyltransferase 1